MPGEKLADGCVAARRMRSHAGETGRAFGDAVIVEQRLAEFLLDPRLQGEIERRARHQHMAETAALEVRNTFGGLELEQPLIGRRHAKQIRDALFGNRFGKFGGIVFRHEMGGRAGHEGGDQEDGKTDDMRHGQHRIDAVVRSGAAQ